MTNPSEKTRTANEIASNEIDATTEAHDVENSAGNVHPNTVETDFPTENASGSETGQVSSAADRRKKAYGWKRRAAFLPVIILALSIVIAHYVWSIPVLLYSINLPVVGIILSLSSAIIALLKIRYNAPSFNDLESGKPGASWAKHNVEVGAFTVSIAALVFFLSTQLVNMSKQADQDFRTLVERNDLDWIETRLNLKLCSLARSVNSSMVDELCAVKSQNAKPQYR